MALDVPLTAAQEAAEQLILERTGIVVLNRDTEPLNRRYTIMHKGSPHFRRRSVTVYFAGSPVFPDGVVVGKTEYLGGEQGLTVHKAQTDCSLGALMGPVRHMAYGEPLKDFNAMRAAAARRKQAEREEAMYGATLASTKKEELAALVEEKAEQIARKTVTRERKRDKALAAGANVTRTPTEARPRPRWNKRGGEKKAEFEKRLLAWEAEQAALPDELRAQMPQPASAEGASE